ncbi:Transcriptional regulator, ArsR family OS=Tsukamurella paurometabola (strain ATCC 8368 / DSM/ CCUG 35730 / CIP 100753 / JCM 10117 / KCTC 9821 / NBRC 16120/ NCIMB 702349 / NCTC 13040) OX=521096 GN=Tpau_0987 PE=4 SV=1 [Tsukamurella paurometabola]|uniref:Transcriptional regulator, ArsR family n=2 Tax=Tsukamurella paurometabola TaxID=2061 RepID=D5UUP9_TSUPD|nr:transcriptional regulator, ArsR family [Tsukamurella paurometabola DSM 20162]SUP27965.1 Bacterial regulatory protein, arsR family [Tsukamurella paurometabola]
MLTYLLDVGDLADARFVLSPLNETALSLFHFRKALPFGPHLGHWRREALARRNSFDSELIDVLVSPSGAQIPDFLTPPPAESARPTFAEHLRLVEATDAEEARRQLAGLSEGARPAPALTAVIDHPEPARRVADALAGYHRETIAPHWPAIERILESDITYRGRELAAGGPAQLFRSLTPRVSWSRTGELRIDLACSNASGEFPTDGRGLMLVPSVFIGGVAAAHDPRCTAPHIAYPARGSATLIEWAAPVAADSLRRLIGAAKADLLVALEEPAAVSELARLLCVSPSAISQSLKVLGANGIVDSARYGRRVLYRRTALGDALVQPH